MDVEERIRRIDRDARALTTTYRSSLVLQEEGLKSARGELKLIADRWEDLSQTQQGLLTVALTYIKQRLYSVRRRSKAAAAAHLLSSQQLQQTMNHNNNGNLQVSFQYVDFDGGLSGGL